MSREKQKAWLKAYSKNFNILILLKGHCTEKMKRLNMIGIKLVKHHNILLKRLPTQIASYSTLKLLDTHPFR